MLMTRIVIGVISIGLMVLSAGVVSGQDYPNKPIRIVTAGAGGGSDFVARLIAQGISVLLGQPVIVENRGGASNIIAEAVAKAPPDGYTLLVGGSSVWLAPLMQKTPYDPMRDFSPITILSMDPNVLVVHPSLPVKSVKELIALAKAKPGELNYSASEIGSGTHLAAEIFKSMTGVNIVHIPYKSAPMGINDLIGGQVQLRFSAGGGVVPYIKSGRLRALAVTSAEPSALFRGLPTVAATVPGYEAVGITGLLAPAKTPAAIITRLNQESVRVLNQADVKERMINSGTESFASSPEQLAATMKSDMGRVGKVIKDAGIKVD